MTNIILGSLIIHTYIYIYRERESLNNDQHYYGCPYYIWIYSLYNDQHYFGVSYSIIYGYIAYIMTNIFLGFLIIYIYIYIA